MQRYGPCPMDLHELIVTDNMSKGEGAARKVGGYLKEIYLLEKSLEDAGQPMANQPCHLC